MTEPIQPRALHLEWCKQRALAYCDEGCLQLALSSMFSDLKKHPKTADHPAIGLGVGLILSGDLNTRGQVRKFIEGFN